MLTVKGIMEMLNLRMRTVLEMTDIIRLLIIFHRSKEQVQRFPPGVKRDSLVEGAEVEEGKETNQGEVKETRINTAEWDSWTRGI